MGLIFKFKLTNFQITNFQIFKLTNFQIFKLTHLTHEKIDDPIQRTT